MQTSQFKALLEAMNPAQQSVLKELEKVHSELMWDGGKVDTRPLRVSIKNTDGKSMAAINTREKDAFLRLEFRSRDYNGHHGFPTQHRNFDKAYDLFAHSNVAIASEIISVIKQKYISLVDNPKVKDKKEEYYKPNKDVQLPWKEKSTSHDEYVIISVMGSHAGESESEIFSRKIQDTRRVGKTFWLTRSRQAKPLMVQSICKEADRKGSKVSTIFIEASSNVGALPTSFAQPATYYSADMKKWENLPIGLTPVTGKIDSGAYALIFDRLELSQGTIEIDLWKYAYYFDQNSPIKIYQGASTLCAVKKDMSSKSDKIKSRYRKIVAIGILCPPYGVWLK